MIELKNITAGYEGQDILRDVSLTAKPGCITTLLGRNGSGKSTLLKTILRSADLSAGEILVEGRSTAQMNAQELAQKIAYLPQGKNVPDITARRMVLHGRFPYLNYPRRYRKEDQQIAQAAMEQMGITDFADKLLGELSGGMRQKVYIAMALAQQSQVIIMDEPTTYLDIGQQMKFARLAQELAAAGKTVVLVLHDVLMALRISHHIAVLDGGSVAVQGDPDTVLASGILERLYDVKIRSLDSHSGIQYYYEME